MLRRIAIASALAALGGLLPAFATEPAGGTLSPASPALSLASGPHTLANPTADALDAPDCSTLPCDDYALTVELPADYTTTHPDALIAVVMNWDNAVEDWDIYLYDEQGNEVGAGGGGDHPERFEIPAGAGIRNLTLRIVPYATAGGIATIDIALANPDPSTDPPPPPPAAGLAPRYQVHVAPPALGNDSGEPTIGYNPLTKHAMFISYVNALRLTFQENAEPPLPQACDALWEDKSGTITTLNSLDPIIYTDKVTGRTFNSQLSGANSLFEYSDDDGETWTPGQIGPPNGGVDHQGVITGPYPAGFLPVGGLVYPNAVYYCSQSTAGAFCARSDDGGQTFGPGMPFKNTDCAVGALHGHPQVAPDGTLYVPDSSQCIAGVGGLSEKVVTFVSEDAGTTFEARPLPESTGGGASDPSVGIASDGSLYMCYENGDGRARVAVSRDKGLSWINDTDIGAGARIVASRFPAAIAGDPDRAACAFLGTSTEGNSESLDFEGLWYPYVATTYDGGETWHLVNVAPNDPVQGAGGVGPSGTNRNLLDFNDLEVDEMGRTLFAYADGCIDACVIDPTQNSFHAKGTVVRQTGGRTLLAAFDDQAGTRFNTDAPLAPAAACPTVARSLRSPLRTLVGWAAPDTGGAPVTNYQVYRALSPDEPFALVGNAGTKTQWRDTTASAAVGTYYYRIVAQNALGDAPASNVLELPMGTETQIDACSIPGEIIALDNTGDGGAPDTDIEYLAVAEPAAFEGNLVVTVKVTQFSATTPPPSSFYPILFPLRDGLFIAMDASQALPRFIYGHTEELPQGLLAFTEDGTLDERSSYAADGTIVMVVPKSLFGDPEPGQILSGWDVRTRVGAQSASSRDTAGPGFYTVKGSADCGLPGVILGVLGASTQSGAAPLEVTFAIGGQPTDGETLESWTLDFGDGQKLENQAFDDSGAAVVAHTYAAAGNYPARLTVTDSAGNTSTNRAERVIEVLGATGGGAVADDNRFGGALGLGLLLPLGLLVGLRRRAARAGSVLG